MPLISTPSLLVSSSRIVLDRLPGEAPPLKNLTQGQVVTATVLQRPSDREVVLMVNGQQVTAKTFLPLASGQTVLLKVEQAGIHTVFKFMGQPEDLGGGQRLLLGALGKERPYLLMAELLKGTDLPEGTEGGGLGAIKQLLAETSLGSDAPSGFLKRLLDASGMLWETKLATVLSGEKLSPEAAERLIAGDLKALALQLQAGGQEAVAPQLKGILEGLEHLQLLNQQLFDTAGRFLLAVPMAWDATFKFGQLLLDLGGRKEGGRENNLVNVSFLLTLSNLGDLRADFSILKQEITGMFGVADEDTNALVTAHLPLLAAKLQAHGFSVYNISSRVLAPEELSEATLLTRAVVSPESGLLNLVV